MAVFLSAILAIVILCCFGYGIYLCVRKKPESTQVAPSNREGDSLTKLDRANTNADPTLELESMDEDQFGSKYNTNAVSAVSLGAMNSELT